MRIIALMFILLLSTASETKAQWHLRSCGVVDLNEITEEEEFECLWNKSTNRIIIGSVTTIIGTSLIVGTIAFVSNYDTGPESELMVPLIGAGAFGLSMGLFLDLIGIPILISGVNRTNQLKRIPFFNDLNSGSLLIYPEVNKNQFTNSYYFGLGLSFSF